MAKNNAAPKTAATASDGAAVGAPSRSQFIRDALAAHPSVSPKEVAGAWRAAGHKDEIKSALFYLVKGKAGLSKKRRKRRATVKANGSPSPKASPGRIAGQSDYLRIKDNRRMYTDRTG
jgi:hypothetical protein